MTPDDLTSRAQGEAERLRPVTGVADDTERRDNLLWGAGYVTGATWAAAQAPSVEALTAEVEHWKGQVAVWMRSYAGAIETGRELMAERDAVEIEIDNLRAGIEGAIRDARYIYTGTNTADPRQVIDAIEELVAQADRRALLAEDET